MQKKDAKRKRSISTRLFFSIVAAVILIFSVAFIINSFAYASGSDIIASINGEPIIVKEYVQALQNKRADIHAYFKQKYGVDDNPVFWTSNYGGEVPLDKIKKDALDSIVKIKVQQILAKVKDFTQTDTIKIKKIAVSYLDNSKDVRVDAEKLINEMKSKLDKGEKFEDVATAYVRNNSIKVEAGDQSFTPKDARTDSMQWGVLMNAAYKLDIGRISEIIDDNGAFYLIKCIDRTQGEVIAYEEARDKIKQVLSGYAYEKTIGKFVEEAVIVINDRIYRKVDVKNLR